MHIGKRTHLHLHLHLHLGTFSMRVSGSSARRDKGPVVGTVIVRSGTVRGGMGTGTELGVKCSRAINDGTEREGATKVLAVPGHWGSYLLSWGRTCSPAQATSSSFQI